MHQLTQIAQITPPPNCHRWGHRRDKGSDVYSKYLGLPQGLNAPSFSP